MTATALLETSGGNHAVTPRRPAHNLLVDWLTLLRWKAERPCTRLRQTSPKALLADLQNDRIDDPTGWFVCRMFVRDVRSLGLEVIHKPTDRDPGHCEIVGKGESQTLAFPNKQSQRLAKTTRILTADEVATLKAGDVLTD